MIEALQYEFMRNALMAGVLVSITCGIIGTFVVINRIVFLSGGIAHAAYGGIGLGYFFKFNPVLGAIIFSLASALGMGIVHRKTRQRAVFVRQHTGRAVQRPANHAGAGHRDHTTRDALLQGAAGGFLR